MADHWAARGVTESGSDADSDDNKESDSDASSFATERSYEVEDFSPPPSPQGEDREEREEGAEEEASGPEPYLFEPLAQEMSEASGAAEPSGTSHRMGPVSEWYIYASIIVN